VAWTKAYRRAHGKELTVDTTLAFAARRNVPVRYNRDLVKDTLRAMERVEEIRRKRERVATRARLRARTTAERELRHDRRLVAENQILLPVEERDVVDGRVAGVVGEEVVVEELEEERRRRRREKVVAVQQDEEEWGGFVDEVEETVPVQTRDVKRKQRLLVGGGVEAMDVDE
jgi:large subunit ribosomal protein L24e